MPCLGIGTAATGCIGTIGTVEGEVLRIWRRNDGQRCRKSVYFEFTIITNQGKSVIVTFPQRLAEPGDRVKVTYYRETDIGISLNRADL